MKLFFTDRRPNLIVGAAVLLCAVAAYGVGMSGILAKAAPATRVISYWIEGNNPSTTKLLTDQLTKLGYRPVAAASATKAAIVLSRTKTAGSVGVLNSITGAPAKLASATIVQPVIRPTYYAAVTGPVLAGKLKTITSGLKTTPANTWSLAAIGDIIIGRTVYLQMQRYGDPTKPFAYFADAIRGADLAVADLECTISDAHTVVTDGGMTFASPASAAAGLKTSGFDAVNVANNHSFNVGAAGFTDTLDAMKSIGIPTFGGGRNSDQAHTPYIAATHGVKVAMLGYSSIVGSTPASPNTPGMAHLTMAPWGAFNEAQAAQMEQDIKAAKAKSDVVMVYYHWGTEYTHDANADQRAIAHRAIDAGADLIIGTHPHWVQGVEWYKNKLITYSLGNFIFDQEWSVKTKQGTYLKAQFNGPNLISAELVPYQIEDYLQPRLVNDATGQSILNDIFTHSWWPAT